MHIKRVAHLYANTNNLGDWGSAEGVKLMIRERFGDVQFSDFFLSFRDLNQNEIDQINHHDLVVIGGGGLLYPRSRGILLQLTSSTFQKITVPIVGYAIGLNYEPQDEPLAEPYLRKFSDVASKFYILGVRDHFTKEALAKFSIPSELVPCPSMFLPKSETAFSIQPSTKKRVGLVPVPLERFPRNQRKPYLETYSKLINSFSDSMDFFLIGHNKNVSGVYEDLFTQTPLPILNPVSPWQLMRAYDQMDFLVGSRGHMGIFALGAGKPFLFLSYNLKCDAFADDASYPDTFILPPSTFDTPSCTKIFAQMLHDSDNLSELLKQKRGEWINVNKQFLERL